METQKSNEILGVETDVITPAMLEIDEVFKKYKFLHYKSRYTVILDDEITRDPLEKLKQFNCFEVKSKKKLPDHRITYRYNKSRVEQE